MIVLAIDTALEDCSVAIVAPKGTVLRERTIGRGHAEYLMPAIAGLLADAGLAVRDLDRIAVSTGPGSFTGLRVGIAAARGLALATGVPVIGVPTLLAHAALAAELGSGLSESGRPILVLLPAREDECYAQLFSSEAEPLEALFIASIRELAERARAEGFRVAGAGAARLGPGFDPVHTRSAPSVATLLELGTRLDPAAHPPVPVYGRPPDAAPKRDGVARL